MDSSSTKKAGVAQFGRARACDDICVREVAGSNPASCFQKRGNKNDKEKNSNNSCNGNSDDAKWLWKRNV